MQPDKINRPMKINRRNFIVKAGIGAGALTIIPGHVMGGKGYVAANDHMNLAYDLERPLKWSP